jgi:hypothetical protein
MTLTGGGGLGDRIRASLDRFYQLKYPDVFAKRASDIADVDRQIIAIYGANAFPDLKVTWGTYPNIFGATDCPGPRGPDCGPAKKVREIR